MAAHSYEQVPSEREPPARLVSESGSSLFLDVDGTLLDIAPAPDLVVVPPELSATLSRLSGLLGGALALVSGRPIAQLDRLFAPLRLPAAGEHGAEIRRGADQPIIAGPPPTVLAISTRLGLAGPYGGTDDLVIEDRFKAGGSTTIRGYPLDRVGPVDSANNPTVCSASRPPLGRSAAPTSSASSCSPDPRRGRPGRDHRGAGRH